MIGPYYFVGLTTNAGIELGQHREIQSASFRTTYNFQLYHVDTLLGN